ncbi:hypothetical protein T439DRAFT_35346 [Meredithblackwellia eburnea MCA 4105]
MSLRVLCGLSVENRLLCIGVRLRPPSVVSVRRKLGRPQFVIPQSYAIAPHSHLVLSGWRGNRMGLTPVRPSSSPFSFLPFLSSLGLCLELGSWRWGSKGARCSRCSLRHMKRSMQTSPRSCLFLAWLTVLETWLWRRLGD